MLDFDLGPRRNTGSSCSCRGRHSRNGSRLAFPSLDPLDDPPHPRVHLDNAPLNLLQSNQILQLYCESGRVCGRLGIHVGSSGPGTRSRSRCRSCRCSVVSLRRPILNGLVCRYIDIIDFTGVRVFGAFGALVQLLYGARCDLRSTKKHTVAVALDASLAACDCDVAERVDLGLVERSFVTGQEGIVCGKYYGCEGNRISCTALITLQSRAPSSSGSISLYCRRSTSALEAILEPIKYS